MKKNIFDPTTEFTKEANRDDISKFDINQLGVFESGKNLKVYLDQENSDLMVIIYNQNLT